MTYHERWAMTVFGICFLGIAVVVGIASLTVTIGIVFSVWVGLSGLIMIGASWWDYRPWR